MEQSKSWMKFNTDATKSSMYAPKNKDLRITMKINPNSHTDIYSQSDLDIQNRRIGTPIEDGNAMTAGVGIKYTFDAEKLLYENLKELYSRKRLHPTRFDPTYPKCKKDC